MLQDMLAWQLEVVGVLAGIPLLVEVAL